MEKISGYYDSTWDWVTSTNTDISKTTEIFKKIYPDETIAIKAGKTLEKMTHPYLESRLRPTSGGFVAVIENGGVWGDRGYVITPDNKFLMDVCIDYIPMDPQLYKSKLPPATKTHETIAVLTYRHSENYFHWMLDVLPRIHLLQLSQIPIDKFVVNKITYPFQLETLKSLGISKEKLIECHNTFHLKAKKLVVTSWINGGGGLYPKWACDFLRSQLLDKDKKHSCSGYERIYVSRADAGPGRRRIINENVVVTVLKKYGFKKVLLTPLSVAKKVNLFASADIIISPNGANLVNLAFCKPGAKVIEIYTPSFICDFFQLISTFVGLEYYYLIGENYDPQNKSINKDILVNINDLVDILSLADI